VLEDELDGIDDDREHHILVLHINLRDCPMGNTTGRALFRKTTSRPGALKPLSRSGTSPSSTSPFNEREPHLHSRRHALPLP
jgi:hypothetical protein